MHMTDQITMSGESNTPEQMSLDQRFASMQNDAMQERVEHAVEHAQERNIVEQNDRVYSKILSSVQTATGASDHGKVMRDASVLHQQTDRESQIKHLIDLALNDGVQHAVAVAQKAEDYYVLDQLHDRLLAEDLHAALVNKGMIEQ